MTIPIRSTVLMAHCYYREHGGEDASFEAEAAVLRTHGREVVTYIRRSEEIDSVRPLRRLLLPFRAIWASDTAQELRQVLRQEAPVVAHFQNIFPLISPSAYATCREKGVPVVQALRNYRLICPKATMMRDGHVCADCVGKRLAWPGVLHACYHGSRAQTAVIATMAGFHSLRGTWEKDVDLFVAPTMFARRQLIDGGLPAESLVIKPNFTEDPGPPDMVPKDGTVLFVGRLSEEKGADDLIRAVALLKPRPRLRVVGDGPERQKLVELALGCGFSRDVFAGAISRSAVLDEMRRSACVVVPSRCFETFGRTVIEAFSCGRPVIASRHGALSELVRDGETGHLFEAGSPESLAASLDRLLGDLKDRASMGLSCRQEYQSNYTPDANYQMLMSIYRLAIERAQNALPKVFRAFPTADVPRDADMRSASAST